ncbi:protein RD3-like [Branchiostoma floridae x Branchiostoma belcheri]
MHRRNYGANTAKLLQVYRADLRVASAIIIIIMPLSSWLPWTGGEQQFPGQKPESMVVADCLMTELEWQLREADRAARDREEEERRRQTKVDYSWLACTSARSRPRYQMSQMDRLELETMCSQVRPEESGDVIVRFRDRLYPEMPPQEIPLVLRAVIRQVFQRRNPAPDSWARRLRSQSMILWTTQSSARVHPSSRDSGGEETGIEMDARRVYSLPDFTAKSVAQLPV